MRKEKRSITRIFLRGFLVSFFIVLILFGAGILAYRANRKPWMPRQSDQAAMEAADSAATDQAITPVSLDPVRKKLIFSYNKKKKTIDKLVLEIFHSNKKQFTYLTIPMTTRYTMSDALYRKLYLVQPSVPQIIQLSAITKYFHKDTVFDIGRQIVSELLGIEISYYAVMPVKLYQTVFVEELEAVKEADLQPAAKTVEVFSEKFLKTMKAMGSSQELRSYIEELYKKINTNEPLENLLRYLDSYYATPIENVAFEHLAGEEQNSGFFMDKDSVRQRFYELEIYE